MKEGELGKFKLEKEPKFRIIDNAELEQFDGRPLPEVVAYIRENYGDKVPGAKERDYLSRNQGKIPQELKDGNFYHFLRDEVLYSTHTPALYFRFNKIMRRSFTPLYKWRAKLDRVLLLE